MTEYPVKCEFCRETAKPLLDEQDPKVGIGFFVQQMQQKFEIYLVQKGFVGLFCAPLRKLWPSAAPSGSSCMRYWRSIDVT